MGMNLIPRNKKQDTFHMGVFCWGWMLDAGVGLILGNGPADTISRFSYVPRYDRCPRYNEGYPVTANEARGMSLAAHGLVSIYRFIQEEWDKLSKEEQTDREEGGFRHLYKFPVRKDFIDKVELFGEWAVKSHGFRIF